MSYIYKYIYIYINIYIYPDVDDRSHRMHVTVTRHRFGFLEPTGAFGFAQADRFAQIALAPPPAPPSTCLSTQNTDSRKCDCCEWLWLMLLLMLKQIIIAGSIYDHVMDTQAANYAT